MLTPWEIDLRIAQRDRAAKAAGLTPQHSACEAGLGDGDGEEDQAEAARRRIQHEADPVPPDAPEVEHIDVGKLYRQAFSAPSGYPAMRQVDAEQFRRGTVTGGEAAYGPDYDVSAQPVPVPDGTLDAAAICRAPLAGGLSRPSAEGC